jgi:hypothetical protein
MSDYAIIPLTQGQYTFIDKEDFERVSKYTWFAQYRKNSDCFVARGWVKGKTIYLANFIMNHDPMKSINKLTVDHINR